MIRGDLALWLPAALAFAGALAPALLARGRIGRGAARAMVLAALAGLAAFGAAAILWPLAPGEPSDARLMPALDAALGVALVALAAVGIRRAFVLALWTAAALALARAGILFAESLLAPAPLTGAMLWAGAAMVGAALGALRYRRG